MKGDMVIFLCLCLVMFFVLYFTVGKALFNFNRKLSKLNKDYNYESTYELVSAGSVGKEWGEAVVCIKGSFFEHNGEGINIDKYTVMVVDGNSMNGFEIKDGDVVFVDEDKNLFYKESPIFVLNVNRDNKNKIKYKLRKAIDFYDCSHENRDTFDTWIKNHPELNANMLYEKYETEYAKIEECRRLGCRLLISETTRKGSPYYSFHPENYIYGKVKYKIPKETVKIIEKR
jgi:hypothetical protein